MSSVIIDPKLLRRAESGNANAMYKIAGIYREVGVTEDNNSLAAEWYQKAADLGHRRAMRDLAHMCHLGAWLFPPDRPRAIALYKRLADLGDREAEGMLAIIYEYFIKTPESLAEALRLYKKGAERGDPDMMWSLAMTLKDREEYTEAWFWFYLARTFDTDWSDSRETWYRRMASKISPEQRAEIIARAQSHALQIHKRKRRKTELAFWEEPEDWTPEDEAEYQREMQAQDERDERSRRGEKIAPEPPPPPPDGLFTGGDGSSFENAVVINETRSGFGVSAEYYYLALLAQSKGLDWELDQQRLVHKDGVPYDILSVNWSDGRKEDVYFDIGAFYGKHT